MEFPMPTSLCVQDLVRWLTAEGMADHFYESHHRLTSAKVRIVKNKSLCAPSHFDGCGYVIQINLRGSNLWHGRQLL
jgi:hypothetical protein